jgi:hypothetical protein
MIRERRNPADRALPDKGVTQRTTGKKKRRKENQIPRALEKWRKKSCNFYHVPDFYVLEKLKPRKKLENVKNKSSILCDLKTVSLTFQ